MYKQEVYSLFVTVCGHFLHLLCLRSRLHTWTDIFLWKPKPSETYHFSGPKSKPGFSAHALENSGFPGKHRSRVCGSTLVRYCRMCSKKMGDEKIARET